MNEYINDAIIEFTSAAIITKIFLFILTICVIWLLTKSAVKHGVLEALEEYKDKNNHEQN